MHHSNIFYYPFNYLLITSYTNKLRHILQKNSKLIYVSYKRWITMKQFRLLKQMEGWQVIDIRWQLTRVWSFRFPLPRDEVGNHPSMIPKCSYVALNWLVGWMRALSSCNAKCVVGVNLEIWEIQKHPNKAPESKEQSGMIGTVVRVGVGVELIKYSLAAIVLGLIFWRCRARFIT